MRREDFDEYIAAFNAQDASAFDRFVAEDLHMVNGTLTITGRQGMKDHYALIWPDFTEELHVERFVSDADSVAIQMWAHFTARADHPAALFGPVRAGETFDFRGLIMYRLRDGQFADILVAYNTFTKTELSGATTELGIPH